MPKSQGYNEAQTSTFEHQSYKAEEHLSELPDEPMIDLVVATCNRTTPLERLLDSLQQQSYKNFIIHLVDQNDKGILDELRKRYDTLPIDYLHSPIRNASHARNLGLSRCAGDIVAFPDDDCVYDPNTLAHVKQAFETHPDAGVITGKIFYFSELCEDTAIPEKSRTKDTTLSIYGCFQGIGAVNIFVRHNLAQRIEGFDVSLCPAEDHPFACCEDIDYLLRLYNTGYRIVRSGRVTVRHPHPLTAGMPPKQKVIAYAKGKMSLCAKHGLPFWFCWLLVLFPLVWIPSDVWMYGVAGGIYRLRMLRERFMYMLKKKKS